MAVTTIKLDKETKVRLEKLREYKRETYDDIIKKMLYVLNLVKTEPEKAGGVLDRIDYMRDKLKQEEEDGKKDGAREKVARRERR
jgi:hypothetical protein